MLSKIIIFLSILIGVVHAETYTGTIAMNGYISGEHRIVVDAYDVSITDLGQERQETHIGKVNFVSNVPNGFSVTISSINKGKLVLENGEAQTAGEFVEYTVSLTNKTGQLGRDIIEPTAALSNFSLETDQVLNYSGTLSTGTDITYDIIIQTQEAVGLKPGVYNDSLILSIGDL